MFRLKRCIAGQLAPVDGWRSEFKTAGNTNFLPPTETNWLAPTLLTKLTKKISAKHRLPLDF
jgi:hypothetical protein